MFSFAASYITTGRWSVSSPASGIVLVSLMVFLLDIVVRMKSNLRCCTEIFAFVPGVDFAGSRKKSVFDEQVMLCAEAQYVLSTVATLCVDVAVRAQVWIPWRFSLAHPAERVAHDDNFLVI